MLFQFEDSGRFETGRPPLARVIVSLRYPIVAAFGTLQGIEPVQRVLADAFPHLQSGQLNQLQVTVNASLGGTSTSQQQQSPMPIWIFSGGKSEYRVVVSPAFTEISVGQSYRGRAQFSEILGLICDALLHAGAPLSTCEAVIVRYINAAAVETGWQTWFRPEIAGWIASSEVNAKQKYSMSQIVLNDAVVEVPETHHSVMTNAVIRHGLVPGVGQDVMPVDQGESFVIDCELTLPTPQPFVRDVILNVFKAYNHEIARFFDYALTEAGREYFQVRRGVNV